MLKTVIFALVLGLCLGNPISLIQETKLTVPEVTPLKTETTSEHKHLKTETIPEVKPLESDIKKETVPEVKSLETETKKVSSRQTEKKEFDFLCEAQKFKYYQAHPTDKTKFIICDPWGSSEVKSCENGLIWDSWKLQCSLETDVKNVTIDSSLIESTKEFNCLTSETKCLNDGKCEVIEGKHKCVCAKNFSGDVCEIDERIPSIYVQIMNDKFNAKEYIDNLKAFLTAQNKTHDVEFFQQFKQSLDKETFEKLEQYLTLSKDNQIRYDQILSNLVEDILEDIYPDVFFLSGLNATSETVVNIVRMIPNLLSYAKYSSERYTEVFNQFQTVLTKLELLISKNCKNAKEEAQKYLDFTSAFLNRTAMDEETIEKVKPFKNDLTDVQVKELMKTEYNETLENSNKLVKILEDFQAKMVEDIKKKPELVDLTLGEVKIDIAKEVIRILDEVTFANGQIWDSLVSYGFWFVNNKLIQKF